MLGIAQQSIEDGVPQFDQGAIIVNDELAVAEAHGFPAALSLLCRACR
jgi:hypothetical protein